VFCVSISLAAQKIPIEKNPLIRLEKSIEEGKLDESERELFSYVIANPKDAKGFALLAKLRLKQNRLSEAKSLAKKALALDTNLLAAKFTLAQASFDLDEIEKSRAVLDGIDFASMTDGSFLLNLSELFEKVGDCPKAMLAVEKLPLKIKNSEALPIRATCFLRMDDKKSLATLIPLANSLNKQNPVAATKFAAVLNEASLYKEAVDLLRQIVASSPKNLDALLLLAKSEIFLKDFSNAKNHIAAAETLQPNSQQLFLVKSFWESEQGNNGEALILLEQVLAEKPDSVEVLAQFVITAIRANKSAKAFQSAEKLLSLQPESLEFLYLYGAASLQNNRLVEAESALTKFLESRPNDSRGCLALGLTFAAQPEKLEQARDQMQKCLKINPNNFEATYQLGLSYKTQGETQKAIQYLEETVRLSPDYASALRDLGSVYLQAGTEGKARIVLERSVSINPNDADTHFQLSRMYNLIGESDLAKKHLEIFQKMRNPVKNGM
jgi:tetratricopeptide (TPR) repeat protein